MKLKHAKINPSFELTVTRSDLEALQISLHHTYHYQHKKLEHVKSAASGLLDSIEEVIRLDDDIRRQASQAIPREKR